MRNKICVTGGAGMIGSALVRKLIMHGHEVIIIDNLWRGKLEYIEVLEKFKELVCFHKLDLADEKNGNEAIELFKECNLIVHLADIVAGIGYVFENEHSIFHINNKINSNVFNWAVSAECKEVIYAGTACSFPLQLQRSRDSELFENQLFPADPESAYGWSKLIGSLELRYLKRCSSIVATTLIFHNVYGPNCDLHDKTSQVIPALIKRILSLKKGEYLIIWGSGNQGRAFVFVEDIVEGIYSTILAESKPEIIQLGPNYCTSIKELVTVLTTKIIPKEDIRIVYDTTKPEGDLGRFANYSLAKNYLGWEPKTSIVDGLKKTEDWIRNELNK